MLHYQQPVDRVLFALADPTRRAIVEQLGRGSASVKELAAPLPMSLAAVVQHVQALEQSGVITTQKVGRVRTCTLELKALDLLQGWLADRRTLWSHRLDRLAVELGESPDADEPQPYKTN